MTSPAWDGREDDPWLPSRLDSRIRAQSSERVVRRAVWGAISGWLVEVARRVFRGGGRPNIEAIWAAAPGWVQEIEPVIQEEIKAAMGVAYSSLLGRGFPWEQRAFVSSYLSEVRNRLLGVPAEVFDLLAAQVAQGVNEGEGIPDIRDRVDRILSTARTPRWANRATVIARTETIGALNAGRLDAFKAIAEETGETFEKVWLSTIDDRTRPSHREADGQRVGLTDLFEVGDFSLNFPGDPDGPAEEVIQCRCTMLLVKPGENTDMSNRQFLGA